MKAPRRPLFICATSLVALVLAQPRQASAQSLPDSLIAAYNTNPQLQAERAQVRAIDEDVPQALAGWRPTVTITGSAGYSHTDTTSSSTSTITPLAASNPLAATLNPVLSGLAQSTGTGPETTRPTSVELSVTQPLYRGGQTVAQTQEALNLVRSERARLVDTEQTVFLAVVTDFMNVVEEEAVVDLNLNNEQVFRRQLEATQDRFNVGEVTRTDVAQSEASYANAIANRQAAQGQLQVYRTAYEHDVGTLPGKLMAPEIMPDLPSSRDEATSIAAVAAPSVIQAQYSQQAAEDNIRVIRGQLLPQISVQGTVEHAEDQQLAGSKTDSEAVIATMTMPLYEGGAVYSQSRAAQQTVAVRKGTLDNARRTAVQAAAQTWEQLQAVRATIVSLKEQIRVNEIALEGVQQEASVGSRTVLDILNQEQTLFQSRVSLVQSQHDEIVDRFTLAQAVGRLTAKNLGLAVDYYDPDRNFELVRNKWIGFHTGQ